jgi:AraC family transcriptional regulator of adaptative response/methylated-DNA-[protein]-cysteine methyltransferase
MDGFIDRAKAYLDARRGERVTLGELATAVGASPFHLQRRFKEAFGVSPRDYQEAHRVESVKSSLQNGRRVADAVFEAGYGSVSRFYEKPLLGMKARDYRARGKGQRISFCSFPSALGTVLVASTGKGVCSVKLGPDAAALERLLAEEFSEARIEEEPMPEVKKAILDFIGGEASLARVPLDIRGTVFQRRVWDELRRIPRGETRTYRQIARAVGAPEAVRAVGSACGANPVALVVPCHRAVRSDGGLGGYAWGLGRKKKLLALEKKKNAG